jgi:hypothetical protein
MAITFFQLLNHFQLTIVEEEKKRLEKAKAEDKFAAAAIGSLDLMAIMDNNPAISFGVTIDTDMFQDLIDSQEVGNVID